MKVLIALVSALSARLASTKYLRGPRCAVPLGITDDIVTHDGFLSQLIVTYHSQLRVSRRVDTVVVGAEAVNE